MTDFSRASSLALFNEYCQQAGLDSAAILKAARLPADTLANPESLIPYSRFLNLLEICAEKSGNPLFALEYGLYQGVAIFGPLLYLIQNARTVGESLQELAHYYHLHSSGAHIGFEQHGDLLILSYNQGDNTGSSLRHISELAMGVARRLMQSLLGRHWSPRAVYLQTAPAASTEVYQRLLGLTPQFNSHLTGWAIDANLMELPLSEADQTLHRLMRQHVEDMEQMTPEELPNYVQHLMRSFLPNGRVTIDLVADYLLLSKRSLQRLLAEEGTSFQSLLESTRKSMAQRYLKDSNISQTQLASLLGYSELSAFSRAFQRWFGQSPRAWKQAQGGPKRLSRHIRRKQLPPWSG